MIKKIRTIHGRKLQKCLKNTADLMRRSLFDMKKSKKRLNPIYWTLQFLGGLVAISSLFFIPYLVNMILGG